MKPPLIIFLSVAGMAIAVSIAVLIGEGPVGESTATLESGETVTTAVLLGHGIEHPDKPSMQIGADGEARHGKILLAGWLFGICQILVYVAALGLGMRKASGLGPVRAPLIAGGIVFGTIFTILLVAYRGFMEGEVTSIVMGFPVPTAWMVYGIWMFPIFFIVLYRRAFDAWYLTDEDRARFEDLLKQAKSSAHGGPEGN